MSNKNIKKLAVVDTNVLLLDAGNINVVGRDYDAVVLPSVVLEECDSKKNGYGEVAYQARSVGRYLAQCKVVSVDSTGPEGTGDVFTKLEHKDGTKIIVVKLYDYGVRVGEDSYNDKRIINTARAVENRGLDVVFISNDVMARLNAMSAGLTVKEFKVSDKDEYEFVKEVSVTSEEVFGKLHNSKIDDVVEVVNDENYSYKFTSMQSGQVKLAAVSNGFINVIGRDTEKLLRRQMVAPINSEQLLASKAIQDENIDIVLMEGPAGSGKNIIAFSNAIRVMQMNKDKYQRLVYVRAPINDEEAGEDIGFLSGNTEKLELYLGAAEDTLDFMMRNCTPYKNGKKIDYDIKIEGKIEELKKNYGMEAIITTGLRGRTFHNAIIILDEATNYSPATMQKVLTRVGKDCKVIVTGSRKQIDNKYLSVYNNGMALLMDEACRREIGCEVNMFAIQLQKVVRSKMAMFAEELFDKKR